MLAIAPTGWLVLGSLAAGAAYVVWSWNAAPAPMPAGLFDRARPELGPGTLRQQAQRLHEAIRAGVVLRLGDDPATLPERRLRACAEGLVVSCGVLSPPGPVRLQLEQRKPGDHPGLRFVIELRRVDGGTEALLRGDRPHLFGLPKGPSQIAAAAFEAAVSRLDSAES